MSVTVVALEVILSSAQVPLAAVRANEPVFVFEYGNNRIVLIVPGFVDASVICATHYNLTKRIDQENTVCNSKLFPFMFLLLIITRNRLEKDFAHSYTQRS